MAELKDKLVTLEDLKEAYDNTVHLDSDYVTGIKGSAESTHRHGDVSLSPANIGAKAIQSSVGDPSAAGTSVTFISNISQNTQGVISPTKKTVASASQSAAGLMSAADKKKLDTMSASSIGALPINGGSMNGDINMGQSGATSGSKRILWTDVNGAEYYIRPYNDVFQLVKSYNGTSSNVLGFKTNGGITTEFPSAWRSAISVYSKAESDSLVATRLYSVRGNIAKSATTGTAVGYGKATVSFIGKTVVVDFECKITTAGSKSNVYDVGISVSNLRSINSSLPDFDVSNGGIIHYYKADGSIDTSKEGYSGEATMNTSNNYWTFARLYNTSGGIGSWSDESFALNTIITGTLYGTI